MEGLSSSVTNGSMGRSDVRSRITRGAGPSAFGYLWWDSAPPRPSIMMANETDTRWRSEAVNVLDRVTAAERRFCGSTSVNKITMLAVADELEAATTYATLWLTANPCPDVELRERVTWMLNTCAEVAVTAQRAVTDPTANTKAVMDRLRYLLTIFDFESGGLDAGYGRH